MYKLKKKVQRWLKTHFELTTMKNCDLQKIYSQNQYVTFRFVLRHVTSETHAFQVKVAKSRKTIGNLENEYRANLIYHNNLFNFFDAKNLILIRSWINGENVKQISDVNLALLVAEMENLHAKKIDKKNSLPKLDFFSYWKNKDKILEKHFQKYKKIVAKFEQEECVFSHNDINKKNFIINNKKIVFIDLEWARRAPFYFDYAQLILAEDINILDIVKIQNKISKKHKINLNKLENFVFVIAIFSYSWACSQRWSFRIWKYKKKLAVFINKNVNKNDEFFDWNN